MYIKSYCFHIDYHQSVLFVRIKCAIDIYVCIYVFMYRKKKVPQLTSRSILPSHYLQFSPLPILLNNCTAKIKC
jgi:hypothetical protein